MRKILILFGVISFMLVGCAQEKKTQTVTTSSSLHNYDDEMITEALKHHLDFPKLTINETLITEEVIHGENPFKVSFSWKTEINPHGQTIKKDPNIHTEIETEDSSVEYYIILMKEWETDTGNVKSYWKYKYTPQTNEVKLIESENNDNEINSTTQSMPSDFNFSIQFGVQKKNEINTFDDKVTKDLIADGTATIGITFTEAEMNDIYRKMQEINIVEMKEFIPEPIDGFICMQVPYEEDVWKITMNSETITHFISGEYCEPTNDAKQLIDLRKYVFNIIKDKDAFKSLPQSKGGYE